MSVSGRARCAGVIGWPVGHSLSPRLHGFWLDQLGLDGLYAPLPVRPEHLSRAIAGLAAAGFKGVNLTIPHKEAGFALADRLDQSARAAGAVNLLIFHEDGSLEGRNTDAQGLADHLRANMVVGTGGRAVLCGAGGAARAAILALDDLDVAEIVLINRHGGRAAQVVSALKPMVSAKLETRSWTDWPLLAAKADLVINATSAGMRGNPPLDLVLDPLPVTAAVCDLVYNPLQTDLLVRAAARGHKTIDGLGMLMHQAVPAFEAFYGTRPQVTPALRQFLEEALTP